MKKTRDVQGAGLLAPRDPRSDSHTTNTKNEPTSDPASQRARGHATTPRHAATPEDNSTARTLASDESTPHTPTQLRLASPARSHARTHERNEYDFPVGLTPQPPIYIYIERERNKIERERAKDKIGRRLGGVSNREIGFVSFVRACEQSCVGA